MKEYRSFMLDGADVLHLPQDFHAASDDAAIEKAQEHCSPDRRMELWSARPKVRCWGFTDCPFRCA